VTLRDVVAWTRRTSGPSPRPSDRSRIIDASLATLLLAYALAALLHSAHEAAQLTDSLKPVPFGFGKHPQPPGWIDYLSVVFTTAPLAWRRRYPLAVFWIVIGAAVIQPGHGDAVTKLLACAIAAYTAAAHSPYRPAAIISLLGAAAAVAGVYQHVLPTLPKVLGAFLVIVPIAAAGTSLRTLDTHRERVTPGGAPAGVLTCVPRSPASLGGDQISALSNRADRLPRRRVPRLTPPQW